MNLPLFDTIATYSLCIARTTALEKGAELFCALIVAMKERLNVGKTMQPGGCIAYPEMPSCRRYLLLRSSINMCCRCSTRSPRYGKVRVRVLRYVTARCRTINPSSFPIPCYLIRRLAHYHIICLTKATRWTHVTNLQNHWTSYLSIRQTPQS